MGEERIKIQIDRDLEDLIPGYLQNRREDVRTIQEALQKGEFEIIRVLGHRMKGSGGGYGLEEISAIGQKLEASAKNGDSGTISSQMARLAEYLDLLEVEFV